MNIRWGQAMTKIIVTVLVFLFIVIPILDWGLRLVLWLVSIALFSVLGLISLAGRAWRGELE